MNSRFLFAIKTNGSIANQSMHPPPRICSAKVSRVEIEVKLFGILRERAGAPTITVDLPDASTTEHLRELLAGLIGDIPCVVALNREYARSSALIRLTDEVALIPPVSGGSGPWVKVDKNPIDSSFLTGIVGHPAAGAIVTFTGVTREVAYLDYEAYVAMAEERIAQICEETQQTYELTSIAAAHRIGIVSIGEPSVVVAVSAPHRDNAFLGARTAIDRIKSEAPIWKVEVDHETRRRPDGTVPHIQSSTRERTPAAPADTQVD